MKQIKYFFAACGIALFFTGCDWKMDTGNWNNWSNSKLLIMKTQAQDSLPNSTVNTNIVTSRIQNTETTK